jgi:hypothetical protein
MKKILSMELRRRRATHACGHGALPFLDVTQVTVASVSYISTLIKDGSPAPHKT